MFGLSALQTAHSCIVCQRSPTGKETPSFANVVAYYKNSNRRASQYLHVFDEMSM